MTSQKDDNYQSKINRLLQRRRNQPSTSRLSNRSNRSNERIKQIRRHLEAPNSYQENKRTIDILASCQVLVVGSGPAGLSAAIGAAKAGADVILMERYGCFGGVITTVGMETLGWYRYEGTQDTEGIGREMERIAERMGGTTKWPYNDSQCLDAESFKIVADNLVRQYGIRPLLHCLAVEVMLENTNTITGVIVESKAGRHAIKAKVVVDATGDADIAHFSGAYYTSEAVPERMAVTPVFNCSGVDRELFLAWVSKNPTTYQDWDESWQQETTGKEDNLLTPYLEKPFREAKSKGIIPNDVEICGTWSALSEAGEATNLNLVHLPGYNCLDVMDLTRAEMEGRRQVGHAIEALKQTVPGFQKVKLRNLAMTLGTRDSRKIVGEYNLRGEDVLGEARFPDSIGIFPEFLDGYNILVIPTSGRYFQVPLGCLIPKDKSGLLVAGRCIAGDKVSHTAMRNMMACCVTGQGAGVAAAMSVRQACDIRHVETSLIQQELTRQGVRLF